MKRMRFLLLVLVLAFAGAAQAQVTHVLLEEDFEGLKLGPNVDETTAGDAVWTDIPPVGWINDDSGVPGIGDPDTDGVTEWAGWAFADKDWWISAAGDQDRSTFELGEGTVAIADPDEWDDAPHADAASANWYKVFLSTAPIDLSRSEAGTVHLEFSSSWRPEFDSSYHQSAKLEVSFDGGEPIELFRWLSDPSSPDYKDYATNETVSLDIDNPEGASNMVITFGMFDAGNDWWWAIDNIIATAGFRPERAYNPYPRKGAVEVLPTTTLTWTPGDFVAGQSPKHRILLSDDLAAVEDGSAVVATQDANSFDASELLDYSTTYYWRIDEANSTTGWDQSLIWHFTTEAFAYPVESIIATTNGSIEADGGPENTINGSGLNADDQHSTLAADMFLATPADGPVSIQYEFDRIYKLHEMLVWNYNVQFELLLGFGMKQTLVEYSTDGVEWTALGEIELAQAAAKPDYTANTVVDFAGAAVKYVRLTANTGWGPMGQFGLSEVRFMFIPAHARQPEPADEAAGVSIATTLTWRPGRDAVSHDVYLGADAEALPLADSVSDAVYVPGALDLGTTYFWKVDEIQDAESWPGSIWSFVTEDFIVVDDFESYDDDENRIYQSWVDGYGVSSNGSTVGHLQSPFAEQTIVKSGSQSMPLFYGDGGAAMSETELTLSQNWTTSGVQSLSIAFHGAAGNTGQLYIKINGTKVLYDGEASDIAMAVWSPWNIDLSSVGANVSNVTKLTIGIEGAGASGVVYIDDIRLYANVPEFIVPVEPDAANLVAQYAFDGNANDGSGNGRNGAVNGTPTYVAGVDGQAIHLNGSTDYVVVGSVGISGVAPRTIAGWVKPDPVTIPDWTNLFGFTSAEGANNLSFDMNKRGGQNQYCIHVYGWEQNIMEIDQEWHHLAATYDGTTIAWYGDGRLVGSEDREIDTEDNVHVGKRANNDAYFPGSVDDVCIYNQAVSAEGIAWLAGKTAPLHMAF